MAAYYRGRRTNTHYFRLAPVTAWAAVLIGMGLLTCYALEDAAHASAALLEYTSTPGTASLHWAVLALRALAYALFGTQGVLQCVLLAAIAAHAVEAVVAARMSRGMGCTKTWGLWALQTFCLGYPSLRLLLMRRRWCAGPGASKCD